MLFINSNERVDYLQYLVHNFSKIVLVRQFVMFILVPCDKYIAFE